MYYPYLNSWIDLSHINRGNGVIFNGKYYTSYMPICIPLYINTEYKDFSRAPQVYNEPKCNYPITYQNPILYKYRIDVPNRDLFIKVYEYAVENGFIGGFPTFNERDGKYEVVLINPDFGAKQDAIGLDPNPDSFPTHIRNVDRYLRDDSRYLSGFPNFHQLGQNSGVTRFYKNAGERRWVSRSELGFDETDLDRSLMRTAQNYAVRQGFAGGFPSFEHRGSDYYEIILLNPNAVTVRYMQEPIDSSRFPMKGFQQDRLRQGFHMKTEFRLSEDGSLTVYTTAKSTHSLLGFTGYTFVEFYDERGNEQWKIPENIRVGVNVGQENTVRYTGKIPQDRLNKITSYAIKHNLTATERISEEDKKNLMKLAEKYIESSAAN